MGTTSQDLGVFDTSRMRSLAIVSTRSLETSRTELESGCRDAGLSP